VPTVSRRGAQAGVQRQAVDAGPAQAQAGLAAFAAAGVAVFALQGFGVDLQRVGELEAAPGIKLAAPAIQRCGGVVEERRRAAVEHTRVGAVAFMRQFHAHGRAAHFTHAAGQRRGGAGVGGVGVDGAGALRRFHHQRGALGQAQRGVGADQVVGRELVAVGHHRAADFQLVGDAPLRVGTGGPELGRRPGPLRR
jgi:hypothetical protein